ncbi:hypothetical protein D3C81_1658350 [compost metagenome]
MTNDKICQLADFFRLAAIVKVLEMAETDVALRDTHQHRARLVGFAGNLRIAGHDG